MVVIIVAAGTAENNTNPIWFKDVGIRKTVVFSCICFVAQVTAGFDEVTAGSFQAMAPWQTAMGNPSPSRLGLITSILYAGGVVGALVGAPIADRWGRRMVMATGAATCLTGSILQSASVNVEMFIISRALIGMGVTQTLIGGPSLVAELAHPRIRGTILSFYNVLWYAGSIVASWLTFGSGHLNNNWSWRTASICQITPSLFVLTMIWFVPESPRFLMARGRREEAHHILATYHANGDRNDELVLFQLGEIDAALELEAQSEKQSYAVLIQGIENRKRMFVVLCCAVFVCFSGQAIITYYFSPILTSVGVTGTTKQTGINGGMQIWNFFVAALGAYLVERVGRRALWLASFIGMVLANIPLIITSAVYANNGSIAAAYTSIVTLFLYNAAFNIGCNPLPYSYTTEILPYSIRAKGLAVFNVACWAFSVVTQWVNPIGLANIGWKFYLVYLVLDIIFVAVIFFTFPETKGHTLEEIDRLFDTKESGFTIEGIEKGYDTDVKAYPSVTDEETKETQRS